MASSALTRPLTRPLQTRMFSAAAASTESASSGNREAKYSYKKLGNGLSVASVDTASPVARLAVVAAAGSRNECQNSLGLSHLLRSASNLKTTHMSQFGITRATQQIGGDLTCEGTREYVLYKSSVNRDVVPKIMEILKEITTKQLYRRWEIDDLQASPNTLKLDLAMYANQPQIRAVELLHEAAFRDTLGRSLFIPDYNIGKFSNLDLQDYCERNFSSGRVALVGVGIDSATMESLGSEFELYSPSSSQTAAASYHGGELCQNRGGDLSFVAVGFEGPSLGSKDLLAAEVLKYVLGMGPSIKYSDGGASLLSKAVAKASSAPNYVSSMSANYSDSGLFGFTAVAPASDINNVVKAASEQLKSVLSGNVSEADFKKAKKQLSASVAMQMENQDALLSWVAEQALIGEGILTPADALKMVDALTVSDVNAAAKKIGSSKPSMGATGNTGNLSYLDKLI